MSLLFTPYVEFFIESLTSRRNADRFWVNLREDACKLGECGRRERSLPKMFRADKWLLRDRMHRLMGSGYKVSKCQS